MLHFATTSMKTPESHNFDGGNSHNRVYGQRQTLGLWWLQMDAHLKSDLITIWMKWVLEINDIQGSKIPRQHFLNFSKAESHILHFHVFYNTSKSTHTAVIFIEFKSHSDPPLYSLLLLANPAL